MLLDTLPQTPTTYLDVSEFAEFVGHIPQEDEVEALRWIQLASRVFDRGMGRIFYKLEDQSMDLDIDRYGQEDFDLPLDLLGQTAVLLDTDEDLTFGYNLVTTGGKVIVLSPPFPPHQIMEIRPGGPGGTRGRQRVRVTGDWGYVPGGDYLTGLTGDTVQDAPLLVEATTLTVGDVQRFQLGQTLIIASEQLGVTDKPQVDELTVARGINGSTAAEHTNSTAISRVVWPRTPMAVTGALGAKLWRGRDSAFAGVLSASAPVMEAGVLWDKRLREASDVLMRRAF